MGRKEKSWSPVSGRFLERHNVTNFIRVKLVKFGTCKHKCCLESLFLLILKETGSSLVFLFLQIDFHGSYSEAHSVGDFGNVSVCQS